MLPIPITIILVLLGIIIFALRWIPKHFRLIKHRYMSDLKNDLEFNDRKKLNHVSFLSIGTIRNILIANSTNPSDYCTDIEPELKISQNDIDNKYDFMLNLKYSQEKNGDRKILYGFFHPYCNAGGGGEKVLWKAVETTLNRNDNNVVVIYTGDLGVTGKKILADVKKKFDYRLDESRIAFVYLKYRYLVDGKTWPHLTLIGQALGSIILSLEAIYRCQPDIWCDTMGYPFGYPAVSILTEVPIVTYTHYPVISTDMLNKLRLTPGGLSLKQCVKYVYWKLFMLMYQFTGTYVKIAITNSTWTNNHITKIWKHSKSRVIFPPCSTEKLIFNEAEWKRENNAIVLAQYRPEKRHDLIIKSFSEYLKRLDNVTGNDTIPKLIFIGSTRSQADKDYVEALSKEAYEKWEIPKSLLEIHTDCPYEDIIKYLHTSSFGINAMWNEHFGIAVVEYVAAGLIPLVHASAGPLLDIVVPWDLKLDQQAKTSSLDTLTGFFFKDPEDPDYETFKTHNTYPRLSDLFDTVSKLTNEEKFNISKRAKACAIIKFSDSKFDKDWVRYVLEVLEEDI
ncbi:hypothetical protein Kpol_1039p43 [Vanderwaltozyma polyspora DSM 70294]|uniref:GDP-Man:Man(3)GlcNAc(2)-PP-Dol alpha-1,2-mannosyltransferase n=1 Tax=Vanderwaltozyma polyspora (strain ATCC 22028 / DSM 70294 / BCRC 21397 / CBS 2163 / NBRC 10782 / NRRL Y-8283 / UCD 57-17) TaxID=436907 RepID=A7THG9_VANPO|nr:uncharacterized protein Kpol_1039p43 [Vanderwaltozyma polyspora DSM 70294]EDO18293.1 hypothetical protein Kpol_1039p43 [Vanderwaltozyma polyspora DSM 70294]